METDKDRETIPEEVIDLGDTGIIELPKFDPSKHIGKKAVIESVTEHKGNYGYYVKFETAVVDEESGFKASKIIGLQKDKEGKIGWGSGTKMDIFLSKHEVKHYRDMKGKEVIVQTVDSSKDDGREFLTF